MESVMDTNLSELDLVALRHGAPAYGLVAGDVGTIVHVHGAGEAYEVEFVAADGRTLALMTLGASEVEPVSGAQILHVRKLPQA
jgi:hypothetical protein